MKERPIIFTGDMVRAILDGRKTQTRRVIKPQLTDVFFEDDGSIGARWIDVDIPVYCPDLLIHCPYGIVGDRLWVRETWKPMFNELRDDQHTPEFCCYRADYFRVLPPHLHGGFWRSPMRMFRWASRITLEITNIRVERVQNINEHDVIAEGFGEQIQLYDTILVTHEMALDAGDVTLEGTIYQDAEYDIVGNRDAFQNYWDLLNAKRDYGWDKNPWVWVIKFKQVELK